MPFLFFMGPSNASDQKGFTFIEILIVVAILLILLALALPTYRIFIRESDLNTAYEELVGNIRAAQTKTLASEGESQHGIHFENDYYVLFQGNSYDGGDPNNEIRNLPDTIAIYDISLAGGAQEIVFERITGTTSQAGTIGLWVVADQGKTRTVCIAESVVGFCGTTPAGGRIQDSRHVHFDLGWSIQNATVLKFVFSGPDPDQTETITMDSFFNAGKTEFDWNNESTPFSVGGVNQVFRVHTHTLTAANTVLSVHRDRNNGENTEELFLYIVDGAIDKEIAHYLADSGDTIVQGAYVFNAMQRQ